MIKILLVEDDLGLSNSVFDFLDDFADVMQVLMVKKVYMKQKAVFMTSSCWISCCLKRTVSKC